MLCALFAGCSVACKVTWTDLQALCRRARVTCVELDVTKNNFDDYEVEYIVDYIKTNVSKYLKLTAPSYNLLAYSSKCESYSVITV